MAILGWQYVVVEELPRLIVERHDNGQKSKEGNMLDGQPEGLWTHWDEGGNVVSQGNYIKGNKDGAWIEYHSNGSLKGKYVYKENFVHGLQEFYWDNGQLRSKCIIKNKEKYQHCIGYKKNKC